MDRDMDEEFLRQAIALARRARARGGEPFGAILVLDGQVVHQAYDRTAELFDPTAHAELSVIREYCQAQRRSSLTGYTLYSSAEPCPMCAGAIHRARLSRVVFGISQAMLREMSGGSPKPSCASIVNTGKQRAEIVGPLLAGEARAVFDGYTFGAKAAAQVGHPVPVAGSAYDADDFI